MKNVNEMNRNELRKACKENGIQYSKLTVGGMRDVLRPIFEQDAELLAECGHTHCPHCGIHLDNGLQTFECMLEHAESQSDIEPITHEFMCLGCGEEFGEECELPVKGEGIKIEKDRPEQNGIVRPSAGGKCRAIWDFCDELNEKGVMPMPKLLKEAAREKGWNENNAVIEMYQWRKFHGIVGRQKTSK